jgi:hypothetical protein
MIVRENFSNLACLIIRENFGDLGNLVTAVGVGAKYGPDTNQ